VTDVHNAVVVGIEIVEPGELLGLPRDSVAVVIPVYGAHELFVQCLQSVLRHTPEDVPIVVADDASVDPASRRFLERLAVSSACRHRLVYVRQPANVGFAANVNAAFATLDRADVVVVNSDCMVGPEWLERLREAALSDTTVATATALTNHGTILSVPDRNAPQPRLPDHLDVDRAARLVAMASRRLRPRIPTAIGHCMYIRRSALELVGDFDLEFSPGYGEEVDFSQRCLAHGLIHVAADDCFVYHQGHASFDRPNALQAEHETLIGHRHPLYHDEVRTVSARETGPLSRALAAASAAVRPLSVTVDGRFLGPTVTGTQVQTVELVNALAKKQQVDLRVLVPDNLGTWAQGMLEREGAIELVSVRKFGSGTLARTDVVHRPSQVFAWPELIAMPKLGHRFVITHLDLISYRNPTYHASFEDWRQFRQLTRLSLALADCVVFMSEHAAADARAEDLVDEGRSRVVPIGVDHQLPKQVAPRRPRALPEPAQERFLLCIGTNFRHKNRVFALSVFEALRKRHGWDGWLVFAGPHATRGTSASAEAEFLTIRPEVAARVADLHAVNESEKLWLLDHAAGVLFPTTYEGFGLVPFEAAERGTPCFFAHQTALRDTLPASAATLVPWNADESADAVMAVLSDRARSKQLVDAVTKARRALTWSRAAEAMLSVYATVVAAPSRDLAALIEDGSSVRLRELSMHNRETVPLPADIYRALFTLSTNPYTKTPFRRLVKTAYSSGYFLKHGQRPVPLTDRAPADAD
jgi:GT2 family glycosyltransferase/glycosyltransferase involved in cell wall biosynthesis